MGAGRSLLWRLDAEATSAKIAQVRQDGNGPGLIPAQLITCATRCWPRDWVLIAPHQFYPTRFLQRCRSQNTNIEPERQIRNGTFRQGQEMGL